MYRNRLPFRCLDGPFTIALNSNGGLQQVAEKENKAQDDFRPKTSYWEALVHMFRGTVGTGILALPFAFNQSGYLGGILGIIAITYLVNYCSVLLAICSRELGNRKKNNAVLTYQSTLEAAFKEGPEIVRPVGPFFISTTNILLIGTQLGSVCVYIIFISSNVKAAMDPYIGEHTIRFYTLFLAIPILAMSMVISLKRLAFISTFGNIVLLCSVVAVMYYSTRDMAALSQARMFGSVAHLPQFFGAVFFASGCLSLVLPLQSEMLKPKNISSTFGVLNMNAFLSGLLYCLFGLLGYLNFGEEAKASVTLNLPQHDLLGKLVQIFLAMSTMTGTALQNYVSVSIIWDDYLRSIVKKNVILAQYCLRLAVVVLTVGVSLLVPNLELVMSIIGTLSQCTLGTIVPCVIHFLTFHKQPHHFGYVTAFAKDLIVSVFSVFILFYSLTSAINGALKGT
ncbi:proton-coupled amino acid transporter-like protein CG1139 isoform X2 [Cimex lectularius]|uniref:Amino acid transporter transmembrane domain-containing protein n=1 Tax=Cimex lectularius TaxID=79782 RepID=A0A8I6SLK6_CIMLE|nr:proton-coupled amino acid transporter-like protein CG1139 isoform X2 [Cimex lectularius]